MTKITLFTVALLFSILSWSQRTPPDIAIDATSREYEVLLKEFNRTFRAVDVEDAEIEKWLKVGQRNLAWVSLINSHRPADQQISLSNPATVEGSPLSQPRVYNFKIIKTKWATLQNDMPNSLRQIIFGTDPLPTTSPVSDEEFIKWLFTVDTNYQLSARYKMRKPWKDIMSAYAMYDVRGYVHIKADSQINPKLKQWSSLSSSTRAQLSLDLQQICWNASVYWADCSDELNRAIKKSTLVAYKDKYMPAGQKNYDSFFVILKKRADVVWKSSNPNVFTLPFTNPQDTKIQNFLKTNIEDEWRWNNWALKLNFVNTSSVNTTHVIFVPGAVAHVNGVAGSEITMDKNSPLSEYDVQWTIRHEFGHVLGFPDCYLEFFDRKLDAFVGYQLDLSNLMCSRRGHLQQKHYDELKRIYYPTP